MSGKGDEKDMTKRLYDEIRGEGISPEKFLDVYNIIRATPQIDLDLLNVPGVSEKDLKKIFAYMSEKVGLLHKTDGVYTVSEEGVEVMQAKIDAGQLKKPITDKIKGKLPKRHGE